ncbi:HEAT repeat-containing protein isoform X2 [Wolffia australiana]
MAVSWGESAAGFVRAVKNASATSSKMEQLRQLKSLLLQRESPSLRDFVPQLTELLQTGQPSPVRRFIAESINDIGQKNSELLPEMIPTLIHLLKDPTPAVARQAISSGTCLFQNMLVKIVLQGIVPTELEKPLKLSWESMLEFKDSVLPMAFQPGNEGVRLLAIKFTEAMILLYTPDPSAPSEPPDEGFSISWVRGSNPVLNVSNLVSEATQCLGMLLDQLRVPHVKSLSNSIIIVLVNCLSSIATKRPSFYGRVLPVLLALDPEKTVIKGFESPRAYHGLKSAFFTCLKCSHPAALPWRPRLAEALRTLSVGTSTVASAAIKGLPSVKDEILSPAENKEVLLEHLKKRPIKEELMDITETNTISSKRSKILPTSSQDFVNESDAPSQDHSSDVPMSNAEAAGGVGENGPIQQLVSTFGALVAQGDKAVQLLDVLVSSISSDLFAEVVMVNMQHLPPCCPHSDSEAEGHGSGDSRASIHASVLADIFSLSSTSTRNPLAHDVSVQAKVDLQTQDREASVSTRVQDIASHAIENLESKIPSLVADIKIEPSEMQDISQSVASSPMTSYVSEKPCPSAAISNSGLSASTSSISDPLSFRYTLPKIVAPVIPITDELKDQIQKQTYLRIIEAYKHITTASGIQLRFSLLSCLGVEFPLELDAWGPLRKHVLDDYLNHNGHDLTLSVLYRLYRETEQDKDFFSSTTAISAYESFLLNVAEAIRDSFPPSDKSLSRLLVEVPYLPKPVVKLLESMCSPSNVEKDSERVTQGLSIVWSLILQRPSSRDVFLKIALQSTVHHSEEVRMKAIRLVANKLFPMSCISQKIEEFASEMLLSVVDQPISREDPEHQTISKDVDSGKQAEAQPSVSVMKDEKSPKIEPSGNQVSPVSEAQRRMSLYFALCTKKHSLLGQLFAIYQRMPKPSKQAVHGHIPILVRTVGCSPDLLRIISELPDGCEGLLTQILNTLTEATIPPPELLFSVRKLYDLKLKDVEILIPILSFLPKDEVFRLFPRLVNLPPVKFQLAVARLLQGSPLNGPILAPPEILIAIHEIDPEKDGIQLKKVMDACSACFELRQVFTQQVFAKALNQLVEQIPLPLLFMRTVIQVVGAFPALIDFIMEILSRLVTKQIWKSPKLWVGFLKCAVQTMPQSFGVLLQLPAAQLENALARNPTIRTPLMEHASQPNIRSSIPRPTLGVLGLVSDPLPPPPPPIRQTQPPKREDTVADAGSEATHEAEPTA